MKNHSDAPNAPPADEALKGCPFCGSNRAQLDPIKYDGMFRVICMSTECGAIPATTLYSTKKGAIDCWNTRTLQEGGTQGEMRSAEDWFYAENPFDAVLAEEDAAQCLDYIRAIQRDALASKSTEPQGFVSLSVKSYWEKPIVEIGCLEEDKNYTKYLVTLRPSDAALTSPAAPDTKAEDIRLVREALKALEWFEECAGSDDGVHNKGSAAFERIAKLADAGVPEGYVLIPTGKLAPPTSYFWGPEATEETKRGFEAGWQALAELLEAKPVNASAIEKIGEGKL